MNSKDTNISTLPFESLLSNKEKDLLLENSNIVDYHKKDIIFRQDTRTSHIMYVREGLVKIYKSGRSSKTMILRLGKPGDLIGAFSIFGDSIHQYSSSAIEPTKITYIDIDAFKTVLHGNGTYATEIIQHLSKVGLYMFNRMMGLSHKQLPGKIADVIMYFAEELYHSDKFDLPLTRKELAEMAGTTKESFIRTLTEFKNDKIIDLEGSNVEIKSKSIIKVLSDLG